MLAATLCSPRLAGAEGVAIVRHAPALHGTVEGSIHQLTAEDTGLNGMATVTGDLLVPGTPQVQLQGKAAYGGTMVGTGSIAPAGHTITVNGNASLRHVVIRSDPVEVAPVPPPLPPAGSRSISLNSPTQAPGDFATLKNLTLEGNAGPVAVPPGAYGNFSAAGNSGFVLGVPGSTQRAAYHFQQLNLSAGTRLDVVGPVTVTVASGVSVGGEWGAADNPAWLYLAITRGGLTLHGNARLHGYVTAPDGTLTISGHAAFRGGVTADRLELKGDGRLTLIAADHEPPASPDADRDGMDDAWEITHGLNPSQDDSAFDNDRDGISNLAEFRLGLSPDASDTDEDGLYDGDEVALGLDPKTANPDTQPPSTPAALSTGTVSTDSVSLSWQPADDNLKVSGYLVYRDGQPIETDTPIREPRFTDTNLPDGEEFTYQVRSFDYAGNLSPLSEEILVATRPADTDQDGLPDEWELKYFGEDPAAGDEDPDGDGLTNLQEFQGGTDPRNFYNGLDPVIGVIGGSEGAGGEIAVTIRRPDGTPWANAPYHFDSSATRRKIAATAAGPFESYQLGVRAGTDGVARAYLEPVNP